MRYVERNGLSASVLGFGCGAVLGRVGRGDSLKAMEAAWEAGITLFDTARSYGYGEAEGLLGEFLVGKRDKAIISTKFGIWPERQQGWKQMAKPIVRGLLKIAPGARALVRRGAASEMTANQFTVEILQRSLEESLRKLRTDYVDILFLHDAPASVLSQEELFRALEQVVSEGKVRRVGISAEPEVIGRAIHQKLPVLAALQFPANVFNLSVLEHLAPTESDYFAMANHPFGGVMRVEESKRLVAAMAGDATLPPELREKLADRSSLLLADVVFSVILQRTGIDVVVPAMMRLENLATNVKAVSAGRFTDAEAALLRERFRAVRS